ncbi:MAG: rane protein [Chthoniobacteraceae bacterium]|nr:rane protein [Chthoniobacteraceae bacterium]
MSFLNGSLFPALLLLTGVPLFIHLLNLQFPRFLDFSSVKHIRETVAQRSRLFRWRHLILLAMRTLFIAAVLLAFLKPVLPRFGSYAESTSGRFVLLVIDHSLSMEFKGGGLSCRQRAESEADKIFNTLAPEDAVNVMLVGAAPATCFVDFSRSHAEAERFVQGTGPGLGRADFTQANASVAHLLAKAGQRAEIYYFSDFQRKNWANVDFSLVPPESRFFFVDVSAKRHENRAILGATMNQAQVLAGDTVTLEIEVGNYRDEPMREPVKVVLDARVSFEKEVTVAPWSVAKLTMPVPPGGPGLHSCEISIAPDELPQDDLFFLTIPVLEKEGILLVSDAPDPKKDAVRFLMTALNPYENSGGSLLPQQIRVSELSATRLASVKKVFFTRAGVLNEAACKLVADFVFHGGGVVYFVDGESDPANLAGLEKAIGNVPLPLKIGAKRVAKNVGTGAQQIIKGDFRSRFLRLFRGAQRQNLALLEFYDIHDASSTGAGQVLLHYADETPAMASMNHGLGTLLLMNFSVSEFSSNLARQRIFPAWVQDIVKNLANDEQVATSSIIGELVEDEVWKKELTGAPLRKPSGQPLTPRAESLGERVAISFVPDELGFYSMRDTRLLHAYGVNTSPEESDLRPIDRALLPEQLGGKGQKGFFVQGRDDFQNLVFGRPVFHWFIFSALGLLVLELAFQRFLKGRVPR